MGKNPRTSFMGINLITVSPEVLQIPFIKGVVEDGLYRTHPEEPSLFSTLERGISVQWMSWAYHYIYLGPENIANFEVDQTVIPTMGKIAKLVYAYLLHELTTDKPLPEKPPSLYTGTQRFVSMAWVLDTARRDNMPPHEAVLLGYSLMG